MEGRSMILAASLGVRIRRYIGRDKRRKKTRKIKRPLIFLRICIFSWFRMQSIPFYYASAGYVKRRRGVLFNYIYTVPTRVFWATMYPLCFGFCTPYSIRLRSIRSDFVESMRYLRRGLSRANDCFAARRVPWFLDSKRLGHGSRVRHPPLH